MRNLLLAIMLLVSSASFAQQMLFGISVPASDVPKGNRLTADLASHYSSVRYCKQPDFFRGEDFLITIAPGLVVKSKFLNLKSQPVGSVSYNGLIQGPVQGEVSFSRYRDRVAGMILLNDGRKFMIDQTGAGYFAVSRVLEGAFTNKEKGPDYLVPSSKEETGGESGMPQSAVGICDSANTCASPSVIDLLIVFTRRADSAWGGTNNTIANLTQAVNNMNTSMTNTGVNNVSFRLVRAEKINYEDAGNMSQDLSRLAGTTDGFMDSVHILRNQYGADLVSLIVGPGGSSCGIAYLNTSSTTYSSGSPSFNVTMYSCAVGNLTLSHEFGHNMGLRHDWYVDASTTPCSHHHGYVNQTAINLAGSSTSSQRWRTIMAYNDHCSSVGISCSRQNRWSNPNLIFNGDIQGQPIGSAKPADEAFAFYRMACQVAAFRSEPTTCAAPSSLSSSSITTSSAIVGWGSVSNSLSYLVEYKSAADSIWTTAATAVTSTSLSLSGLQPATLYYWRVRTNCSASVSSFGQSQFTTTSPCTTPPASLTTGSITASSATLSWGAVSGATGYDLQYRRSVDTAWIDLLTNSTLRTYNLTGLTPSTSYSWRVRAICASFQSNYSQASFTTSALAVCRDAYETNNTSATAKSVGLNKEIPATISTATDIDWFTFTTGNNSSTNVRIRLYNLTSDYDVFLYNSSLQLLGSGEKAGLVNDTVVFNSTLRRAKYFLRIVAKNGGFDPYVCYRFRVDVSATPYASVAADQLPEITTAPVMQDKNWFIYPVPAKDVLNIFYESTRSLGGEILLTDVAGRRVQAMKVSLSAGANQFRLNLTGHSPGVYFVCLLTSDGTLVKKLVIQK